jgi:hypothetical protein
MMFSTTVIVMKWRAVAWCVLFSLDCAACEKRPYEKVRSQIIAADPQVQSADAALNDNAYDQAIAMYSEILSQRQENPLMYFKRGYAYYKAGRIRRRLRTIRRR